MKRKLLALLLATLLLLLCACSGDSVSSRLDASGGANAAAKAEPTDEPAAQTAEPEPADEPAEPAGAEEQPTAPVDLGTPVIEEQLLCDQDGVRITATGYKEDDFLGPCVTLLIENNTEKNITVSTEWACVNGYMMYGHLYAQVVAGKKANESLSFLREDLANAGVTQFVELVARFTAMDPETYDRLFITEPCSIRSSLYGVYEQPYDDSGELLYDEGGVRIVSKGYHFNDIWGHTVLFYAENNTDRSIVIGQKDISIDGFMVSGFLYLTIEPGMRIVDDIYFSESDLEKTGITAPESVELSFEIRDADSYNVIDVSDPVVLPMS